MLLISFCTRFIGLIVAASVLLVVTSCGGGGSGGGNNTPPPPQLTSINVSQSALTLDRWDDSVTISAQAVDQNGANVSGATITWSTPDANIASVDNTGKVTSWMAGTVNLSVEATLGGITVSETVAVTVAVQQNTNCQVPTEFPVKPPVAPPANWVVQDVNTDFFDYVNGELQEVVNYALDIDSDGDLDLLIVHSDFSVRLFGDPTTPVPSDARIYLNEGGGVFVDATAQMLLDPIPWDGPRWAKYADINGDGRRDVVAFQQGFEGGDIGTGDCSLGGDYCPGAPNLILSPQPGGGLRELAPTNLNPYETEVFSHTGAVADVDCDGDIDILEPHWWGRSGVHHLQINAGDGTFVAEDDRFPENPDPGEIAIPGSVFCDLDRDGDQDMVVALAPFQTDLVLIAVNDGFGFFRFLDSEVLIPTRTPVDDVHFDFGCGDVDLNGYPDLVMAANRGMELYLNDGDMIFRDVTDTNLGTVGNLDPNGQAVIDLNNDGWLDLIPESDQVSVLWNSGDGVFVQENLPLGFGSGKNIAVGDFDGDGRIDIHRDARDGQTNRIAWNQ